MSRPAAVQEVVSEVLAAAVPDGLSPRALADVTRALADRTDRDNGLVIGTSLDALAALTQWSRTTVRRVIAFLVRAGRVCRVGVPLSSRVLGTEQGLTPVYAFVRPRRLGRTLKSSSRLSTPPRLSVGKKDLPDAGARATRSEGYEPRPEPHGKFDPARTRRERRAATTRLLAELGLVGRVSHAAAAAALAHWWREGWCVAGLEWAVHHRPGDLPGTTRGAASNGTLPAAIHGRRQEVRDPLRLVLWRLSWWRGQIDALPEAFAACDPEKRRHTAAVNADPGTGGTPACAMVRTSRMAEIKALLSARRERAAP